MKEMVFNSSMPRSGSELLQCILHQNPEIYGSPTSPLLEYIFGARANRGTVEAQAQPPSLMDDAFFGFCREGMQGYYGAVTDRPVVCDKSRGWIAYYTMLEDILQEKPKVICMVRDLRAIFGSLEKVWRSTRHRPIGPDNPVEMNNLTIHGRVNHWRNTQPVGLGLQRLYDARTQGYLDSIHVVKFEDLTSDPKGTIDKVYDYLGVTPFKHDFENVVKEVKEIDSLYGPYGSHSVKPSVESRPVDYEQVLGIDLCTKIIQDDKWYYDTFYS